MINKFNYVVTVNDRIVNDGSMPFLFIKETFNIVFAQFLVQTCQNVNEVVERIAEYYNIDKSILEVKDIDNVNLDCFLHNHSETSIYNGIIYGFHTISDGETYGMFGKEIFL